MKQTVLIGLGGTGSRVVNNVAKILQAKNIGINDGIVTCAVLDTNQSDNDLISGSGTGIPVIPTCDERTIDKYLADYAGTDPRTWCPYSRSFGQESMIDGASEIRVKSRIAFMDTMSTGKIMALQNAIEAVFHNRPGTPEKIRVMLVSSLSGGTGSGMFIQTALWLRQFFESRNCLSTIRGIFLLPDIFVRTIPNIRDNDRKKLYHYANAYAAIRELNAINKVIKSGVQPERPIVIHDLFDSRKPCKRPVFDNAFFIDDVDAKGAAFDSIGTYEEMVAQIVYMQLYAPMHSELSSVEDNLFRAYEASSEPLFGSCGTARAEYPAESIVEYCALRAARDAIATDWYRLDGEIDARKAEEKLAEKDGVYVEDSKKVSRRDLYIKLFDEISNRSGDKVGSNDRLLVSIRKDVLDITRITKEGGEIVEQSNCKVKSFFSLIEEAILRSVTENGDCRKVERIGKDLPDPENSDNFVDGLVDELKGLREKEKEVVNKVLKGFDEKSEELADAIIRAFVPLDMGAVNQKNEGSLFGMFLKKDADNGDYFVHPVAAKYLLYKLSQMIEIRQNTLTVVARRKAATEGAGKTVSFDNPKTRKVETMDEYWDQLGFYTSKSEIAHFIRCYKKFNTENKTLCMQYETELLTQLVLKSLKERVDTLIKQIEKLFEDFSVLTKKLDEDTDENVKATTNSLEKVLYVYAQGKHKETKYQSLGIDRTNRNNDLNKQVIEAIYGKFCAVYRPSIPENEEYAEKNIISIFYNLIVPSFKTLVKNEYKDGIYFDIIRAIKEESDFKYAEDQQKKKESIEGGEYAEDDTFSDTSEKLKRDQRHRAAILDYRNRLSLMAEPFLSANSDSSLANINDIKDLTIDENDETWMTTESGEKIHVSLQTGLTFWGFHPYIAKVFPEIESTLGANKATAASEGYGIRELYCYSSIYGVKAESVDKFNEEKGGDYYKHYSAVINAMLKTGSEIDTPHIDKTWHEFLPYVSSSRQKKANQTFFKTFWRAIAYGRITIDGHGNYQISVSGRDAYDNVTYALKPLLENGRTIGTTDIYRLIKSLRSYPDFELVVAKELEERFQNDVEGMSTYIGTDIIQGLITEGELNPITMIVRYGTSKNADREFIDNLIGGLKDVVYDVAARYDMNRTDEKVNIARIKLCHKIYEKCDLKKKNAVLDTLIQEFKLHKLPINEEEGLAAPAAAVEDII